MSFSLRLFGYKGMVQTAVIEPKQYSSDNAFMLTQPYLWAQNLATNGATPVSSAINIPDSAGLVLVEIPLGQSVRYEINGGNRSVAASVNSPILLETARLPWPQGATISIIDASGT